MSRPLRGAISICMTALGLWLSFRHTDWNAMKASLVGAKYQWVVVYFVILLLNHLFRTIRWGYLLSGIARIPFEKLNNASGIGGMFLVILPFRLGELARPLLIAESGRVRKSEALASALFERIVDGMSVAALLWGLLWFVSADARDVEYVRFGAHMMFGVFMVALLVLVFAAIQKEQAVKAVGVVVEWISVPLAQKAMNLMNILVSALRQLPPAKGLLGFFLFTAAYWGLNAIGMSVLARAFVDFDGQATLPLGIFEGTVVMCVMIVGVMLPAAPGSAGTFQAFVMLGLALFIPSQQLQSAGVAYANILWLSQVVQQIGLGLLLLLLQQRSFRGLVSQVQGKSVAAS